MYRGSINAWLPRRQIQQQQQQCTYPLNVLYTCVCYFATVPQQQLLTIHSVFTLTTRDKFSPPGLRIGKYRSYIHAGMRKRVRARCAVYVGIHYGEATRTAYREAIFFENFCRDESCEYCDNVY